MMASRHRPRPLLLVAILLVASLAGGVARPQTTAGKLHTSATRDPKSLYPARGLEHDEGGLARWPGGRLLRRPADNSTSDWQGLLLAEIADLTLKQMILPGTHDSGAYELTDQIAPGIGPDFLPAVIAWAESIGIRIQDIITPWALSQTLDLHDQAMLGIRYFDLRICWNGSDFTTLHFEVGNLIATLLTDVRRFLDDHPREIVVIEGQLLQPANSTMTVEDKQELASFILSTFEGQLYPEAATFNLTYRQLLASNYRVLFTIDDATMYAAARSLSGEQLLWHGHDAIWNTYANTHDYATMVAFNTQQLIAFNSNVSTSGDPTPAGCHRFGDSCLFKVSWTLTTDADSIFSSLQPGRPRSLIEMADTANTQLSAFVNQPWITQPQPPLALGNILIIDDFTNSPLVAIAIQQNRDAAGRRQTKLNELAEW